MGPHLLNICVFVCACATPPPDRAGQVLGAGGTTCVAHLPLAHLVTLKVTLSVDMLS